MPSYDMKCLKCEKEFETFQSFAQYDKGDMPVCSDCGGKTERLIKTFNFEKLEFPCGGMFSKMAGKYFSTKTAMKNHAKEKNWNWKLMKANGLY